MGVVETPQTLVQFRKYEGTVYAENKTAKKISVNEPEREVRFWLQGKNQPDSIIVLPPRALDVPGFQRLVQRGDVYLSVDEEEMEEKIVQLTGNQVQYEEQRRSDLLSTMGESNIENDLVQVKCLVSGEEFFQKIRDFKEGVPPLTERFRHLAYQFVPTKDLDGKFTFTRIQVDK